MIIIEEYDQLYILVDPKKIIESFPDLPFPLKNDYKEFKKDFHRISDDEIKEILALEIKNALKEHYTNLFTYNNVLVIIKTRIANKNNNKGKSGGWRIIGLLDKKNELFVLFDIYEHSGGKDNISKDEKDKLVEITKEYSMSL